MRSAATQALGETRVPSVTSVAPTRVVITYAVARGRLGPPKSAMTSSAKQPKATKSVTCASPITSRATANDAGMTSAVRAARRKPARPGSSGSRSPVQALRTAALTPLPPPMTGSFMRPVNAPAVLGHACRSASTNHATADSSPRALPATHPPTQPSLSTFSTRLRRCPRRRQPGREHGVVSVALSGHVSSAFRHPCSGVKVRRSAVMPDDSISGSAVPRQCVRYSSRSASAISCQLTFSSASRMPEPLLAKMGS
jgi:hypothetical protein